MPLWRTPSGYLNIAELAEEYEALKSRIDDGETLDEEDRDRFAALASLEDDLGDLGKAEDMGPFVPYEDFQQYAMDLADDLHGEEMRKASWPFDCSDWEKAADDLRVEKA